MGNTARPDDCMPCHAELRVRWMLRADMESVVRIERESFADPWPGYDFCRYLSKRNCIGMVVVRDDIVIGFTVYEFHTDRIRLVNFAVSAMSRRQGAGRSIVQWLQKKLSIELRNHILVEVRETNLQSQLFFRAMGFRAIDIIRNHYDNTDEDAYVMQYCVKPAIPSVEMIERDDRDLKIGRNMK